MSWVEVLWQCLICKGYGSWSLSSSGTWLRMAPNPSIMRDVDALAYWHMVFCLSSFFLSCSKREQWFCHALQTLPGHPPLATSSCNSSRARNGCNWAKFGVISEEGGDWLSSWDSTYPPTKDSACYQQVSWCRPRWTGFNQSASNWHRHFFSKFSLKWMLCCGSKVIHCFSTTVPTVFVIFSPCQRFTLTAGQVWVLENLLLAVTVKHYPKTSHSMAIL